MQSVKKGHHLVKRVGQGEDHHDSQVQPIFSRTRGGTRAKWGDWKHVKTMDEEADARERVAEYGCASSPKNAQFLIVTHDATKIGILAERS